MLLTSVSARKTLQSEQHVVSNIGPVPRHEAASLCASTESYLALCRPHSSLFVLTHNSDLLLPWLPLAFEHRQWSMGGAFPVLLTHSIHIKCQMFMNVFLFSGAQFMGKHSHPVCVQEQLQTSLTEKNKPKHSVSHEFNMMFLTLRWSCVLLFVKTWYLRIYNLQKSQKKSNFNTSSTAWTWHCRISCINTAADYHQTYFLKSTFSLYSSFFNFSIMSDVFYNLFLTWTSG